MGPGEGANKPENRPGLFERLFNAIADLGAYLRPERNENLSPTSQHTEDFLSGMEFISDALFVTQVTLEIATEPGGNTKGVAAEVETVEEGFGGAGNEAVKAAENSMKEAEGFSPETNTTGWGPADPPIRHQGPWTQRDLDRAANGQGPLDFIPTKNSAGKEVPLELHHGDQMPGSAVHEAPPFHKRTVPHPSGNVSQGVTDRMRKQDTNMH